MNLLRILFFAAPMLIMTGVALLIHRHQVKDSTSARDNWLSSPRRRVEFAASHPILISVAVISVAMLPWLVYIWASEHSAINAFKIFVPIVRLKRA